MAEYLSHLNQQQYDAVTTGNGPVLVVAGAGSGKTRVLTGRIAFLLEHMNVTPHQIMAVTFTNKAAKEMETRLGNLLEDDFYGLWVGTFHRICLRILRMEGEALGITPDFVIYDDADQKALVKTIQKQQGTEEMMTPSTALRLISDAKNNMMSPEAYAEVAFTDEEELVANIYLEYEKRKKANNALDFDDLLLYTVDLFSSEHEVLRRYRERFTYILVDEYQDTNEAQYRLLRLLAGKNGNLFVVGDPDQSIYAFRGAKIENILNFQHDYPGAQVYRLEQNYRSTAEILNIANALIDYNSGRLKKNLYTEKSGEPVEALMVSDEKAEGLYVAETAKRLHNNGKYRYQQMAVFYRTHAQSRALEEKLQMLNVPYKVFGGLKYYDRKEIKDTVAYLRTVMNPNDNVSLLRIINEPKRGIGNTTIERLEDLSTEKAVSVWNILEHDLADGELKAAAKRKLESFRQLIRDLSEFAATHNVTQTTAEIWRASGYKAQLEAANNVENTARLENMEEFLTVTSDYDKSSRFEEDGLAGSLADFLATVSLGSDTDEMSDDDYVTLMTIHMAKGLEFPVVFLVGMEEMIFPHTRSVLSGSTAEIEEERRLCYVGVTRAMDLLKITRTYRRTLWGRTMYNKPSRFLEEMNIRAPEKRSAAPINQQTNIIFEPTDDYDTLALGDHVRHLKFGEGVVVFVDADGEKAKVAFPDCGIKEFLLAYAKLEKL